MLSHQSIHSGSLPVLPVSGLYSQSQAVLGYLRPVTVTADTVMLLRWLQQKDRIPVSEAMRGCVRSFIWSMSAKLFGNTAES
eukprot:1628484-Rhodomonas_salina.1